MQAIAYELKYCERCGSLRLRHAESGETYCRPCERVLYDLPLAGWALQSKVLLRAPRIPKDEPVIFKAEQQLELFNGRLQ